MGTEVEGSPTGLGQGDGEMKRVMLTDEEFKALLEDIQRSKLVWVCGSFSKGLERDGSDIDFVVRGDPLDEARPSHCPGVGNEPSRPLDEVRPLPAAHRQTVSRQRGASDCGLAIWPRGTIVTL